MATILSVVCCGGSMPFGPVARLMLVAVVVAVLIVTSSCIPVGHAVVIRLQDLTIDNPITIGPAVDSVLLDRVRITGNVPVVFDVAAMLPGALRIDIKDCVCEGGPQIYVRGYRDEPATDQSLEVDVSGLTGLQCSLVFAYNLPAYTNVTIRDSMIETSAAIDYHLIPELYKVCASPLVLCAISLLHMQLRVNNTVLKTSNWGSAALYVGSNVHVQSSAVVLNGVSLEASGGSDVSAMYVPPSMSFILTDESVFSVTNVLVKSSGGGFLLGDRFTVSRSVLRFVGVEGHTAKELVRCEGGSIEAGGWLDLYRVSALSKGSLVASLSAVSLGNGVVSFTECVASGPMFASGLSPFADRVFVQCNRAGGKILQTVRDYREAGLPSVGVVPCDRCEVVLMCFSVLTASFKDCACSCDVGGLGKACLPFDVPLAKTSGGGADICMRDVTVTESMSIGSGNVAVCFERVVFSRSITVRVHLRAMNVSADVLNITLRHCLLIGGAQLIIESVDEGDVSLLPRVHVNMIDMVAKEGTIVFRGVLPPNSRVLLANSTLRSTADGSMYVPTTAGQGSNKYGAALVLDSVSLLSAQFVMTRTWLTCGGDGCAAILVVRKLSVKMLSSFYMDNCIVTSWRCVMLSLNSDLSVGGGSVFSIQNNLWQTKNMDHGVGAMSFKNVIVSDGSVLQFVSNKFDLGFSMLSMDTLTVEDGGWLVHRDNEFSTVYVMYVRERGVRLGHEFVWSILRNNFMPAMHSGRHAYMTNPWRVDVPRDLTVYGMCNSVNYLPVKDYYFQLGLTMEVKLLPCGACAELAMCFNMRTKGMKGCECMCIHDGYGDTCLPAPVPDGLGPMLLFATNNTDVHCVYGGVCVSAPMPKGPPPPLPPAFGECINDTMYPEVTQSVGSGLSWLCYRNVTFSGGFMRLTVDIGAMVGDVVNITFDGCRWRDGAVLLLLGSADAAVGSLSITITGNTFEDALLSPEGEFPSRTNITINGNQFRVTRLVNTPEFPFLHPSCVAMNMLVVNSYSAVTLSGNTFQSVAAISRVIHVGDGGMTVSQDSLFGVMSNKFIMEGKEGTPIFLKGSSSVPSLNMWKDSAVVIQNNAVFWEVTDFFKVFQMLRVEFRSAVVLRGNLVQASHSVFCVDRDAYVYYDSWMQVSDNRCRGQPSRGLTQFGLSLNMRASTVAVSGNNFVSNEGLSPVMLIKEQSADNTNGTILFACNTLRDGNEAGYEIPPGYNVTVRKCGEPCTSETSCFPAHTREASRINCSCTCAVGGYGDSCLPVNVPGFPGDDDPCVRDVTLNEAVEAGLGVSAVCYVGVNFTADVVVDVSVMFGSVRNVTLINCTMGENAGLYVMGWMSDPPAGLRVDVWISGLVSSSGGGVLLANGYPSGSRVTVVDSTLMAQTAVAYRDDYDLGGVSACLVLYDVKLEKSVLTIARTQVMATFKDAVGMLVVGDMVLPPHSALYVNRLSVQTAMGLCVSVDGGVKAVDSSVLSFSDSDFLLCKHAVSVSGAVTLTNSVVTFVRNTFASTQNNAVSFGSTVHLNGGSMLLMKGNVHDSVTKEILYAAGTVTADESTLSFVRNEVLFSRMLSMNLSLGAGAHVRVTCNRVDGIILRTAEEYAVAGFGKAESIDVVGCDTCDKETYCYASGTSSASVKEGECVCVCNEGIGYGEACVPVAGPALPPARGTVSTTFVLEDRIVDTLFVVPKGAHEVRLRNLLLDGVHPVIYVPWMAGDGVRIVVQNVSLRNSAVLYVMGGAGVRRGELAEGDDGWAMELSICGVDAVNGAIVLMGAFPAGSALTFTDSQLATLTFTPLVYLPGSQAEWHAPSLVLWNLRLVRSLLLVSGVAFVSMVTNGQPVIADGAVLELVGSGVALDSVIFGGCEALHADATLVMSGGSVLRLFESQVYALNGLVFGGGVSTNASAVVVLNNTGALSGGSLVTLPKLASFVSGSWLSVRGNVITGVLLSLPSYPFTANFSHSTLTLYENTCSGSFVMRGNIALEAGARRKFIVGCLTFNGQMLFPMQYMRVGIQGETRFVECDRCDLDVSCFTALTISMPSCRCFCYKGGYGRECLPVYLPRVDGCNRTPAKPPIPSPTPTQTPTFRVNLMARGKPRINLGATPHALSAFSLTFKASSSSTSTAPNVSPSISDTPKRHDVACPVFGVTTTAAGGRLTQSDIRNMGDVPRLLMVTLPSLFRWSSDPQLGKYLTFVVDSAAQPNGFSGPWGVMLRNTTWNRSATDPRSVLELEVPVYGGYFIGTDETIFIRGDPSAVSGGCNGELVGSFTIASNTPPLLLSALSVISGAVAAVTTVAVVIAGGLGSILEIQTLGVFAKMSCASVQERASSIALPYFLSVFAGLEDPLWMVVGNALIVAVFGCVHYGLTVVYQRWRGVDVLGAWAAMRFPSLTYLMAYLMHLGIFFGSVFMMAMPGAQARHYVIGVAGLLYSAAFPVGVCYFIGNYTGVGFTKYWQFSKKPFHERWLYPIGYWHPEAQQQMYGSIFTNMKGSYVHWCVFQLLVLCLVALIAAVHPPVDKCHVLYFCMAAVLLAGAGVVAFTNMMRSAFLTVMHTTSFLLLAVLCLINAANYLSPNDGGVKAYAAMVLLLMTVLLAITVYNAVVWYVETLHWQSLREPRRGGLEELLNADTESDNDDTRDSGDKAENIFNICLSAHQCSR